MNEFSLGDGKGKPPWCRNTAEGAEVALKELNIAPVRGGRDRDHKIIHVGDHNALGDHGVQWRNINNEEEGRDGGALGGTHRN